MQITDVDYLCFSFTLSRFMVVYESSPSSPAARLFMMLQCSLVQSTGSEYDYFISHQHHSHIVSISLCSQVKTHIHASNTLSYVAHALYSCPVGLEYEIAATNIKFPICNRLDQFRTHCRQALQVYDIASCMHDLSPIHIWTNEGWWL